MGFRYLIFRIKYLFLTKTGVFKKRFPINPIQKEFINLDDWKKIEIPFFIQSKNDLKLEDITFNKIKEDELIDKFKSGVHTFFSSKQYDLGPNYDWITNPDTGFKYDVSKHWSEIADLSKDAGDIKYVWEKARFSWVYLFIRYDRITGEDQSKYVYSEIENFIDSNPINQGPNYKCSQEISLRVMNWTYCLFYFRDSENLSPELFNKIINSIYWQLHHVYKNIDFSRISVRNNHAITETLTLFLSQLLYPFIPETTVWGKKGRVWFEEEIEYQIYEDGSFLQFSHNYHRVVIQLLTWGIKLSELNKVKLSDIVYERAKSSVLFLFNHQDEKTGWLPNYGMNDGALFFQLNKLHYRNYKPQLQALANVLGFDLYSENYADTFWYSSVNGLKNRKIKGSLIKYDKGGFYGFREDTTLTTIRCGTYKDRPAQADALHLDIWHNGENVLFDPGTYKYNTDEKYLKFYHGTIGHNTLTIGEHSQMLKGGRFIWYYWTKAFEQEIKETKEYFEFTGYIKGFNELGSGITHYRKVIKYKNELKWTITDESNYNGDLPLIQHWNIIDESKVKIIANDFDRDITPQMKPAWKSELYGVKTDFQQIIFSSKHNKIETTIEILS